MQRKTNVNQKNNVPPHLLRCGLIGTCFLDARRALQSKDWSYQETRRHIEEFEHETPEEDFWAEGSFVESVSSEEMKQKELAIHMKHNEEMNYNCKQCNTKISAHNKDWHAHFCDKCFDRMMK